MANTYTSLFYHIVFSTKGRRPWIQPTIAPRIWEYMGGVARAHKMTALQVGGMEDHAHVLVMAPPTLAPSQIAQSIKGDSSSWMHETFPSLVDFAWQAGYGAFSVSKSAVPIVVEYIKNQPQHHRQCTFQEEYLEFLQRHGVEYDERYLWG
jgi:REP element-mobilizing transposase RayT